MLRIMPADFDETVGLAGDSTLLDGYAPLPRTYDELFRGDGSPRQEVADLVDGVSKLTHLRFRSRAEAQAENFRKMLLAMTKDIRVIMIKLSDRLHNMRTLGVMGPNKARRIARETLDIYAPIANRLGINSIRHELQELGMAAHWPWRYSILRAALRKVFGEGERPLGALAMFWELGD